MGGYSLLDVLNFCVAIISLIVLFDVIYKHRRNSILFLSFILILVPIFLSSILIFFIKDSSVLFNIIQLNKLIFITGSLILLCYLYKISLIKYIYIFAFLLFVMSIVRSAYTIYYNIPYIVDDNMYYYFEIHPFYNLSKIEYLNIIRIIIVILLYYFFFFFCVKIVLNSKDNLYYNKIKKFTSSFLIYITIIAILFFIKYFFKSLFDLKTNMAIQFLLQIYLLLIVLYRPDFLNRVSSSRLSLINKFNTSDEFVIDAQKFDHIFFIELSYIKNNFNITVFANELNVNKDDLVIYINNRFGLTCDDFINKQRVAYFVELIKNPNFKNYTIDALSKMSGFVSRNAFYKPFKKFHGGNPSDLIDLFS